ncbi:MAG TPA: hypothetical protein VNZ49_12855 [Bacteroidia bacterium]|jgi:hypothetical protein|nr:hypothetical protein [Bacteroidia bacterium]
MHQRVPVNKAFKEHFLQLVALAKSKANSKYADLEKKLKPLDHFNQLRTLLEEVKFVDKEVENSDYPFYIENHSSEYGLQDQFTNRTVLLNKDESEPFLEAVSLGSYRWLLVQKEQELEKGIPAYSYDDFMSGKIDPYFSSLENQHNISKQDYYKIRIWQSEEFVKIVTYESLMLIKSIQGHCKKLQAPIDFIISERQKFEILENGVEDIEGLKENLKKLFIFQNQKFPKYNDDILWECYQAYLSNSLSFKYIFPQYLNPLIKEVEKRTTHLFSNEVTLFFTINKISEWFEFVADGQAIQTKVRAVDWDKEFEYLELNATSKAADLINELNEYVERDDISEEEVKRYLIEKLDSYREQFNRFEAKYIFAFTKEEERDRLKRTFLTNSFFGNALIEQSKLITEAIIIHEVSWEIVKIYATIFDTIKLDFPGRNDVHSQVMDLLNQMVLDKNLYNKMCQSLDDFMQHFHNYYLPIEIHFQNQRVNFSELFYESLNLLTEHINNAQPNHKILYLQEKLRDLKKTEIQFARYENETWFEKREFKFFDLFKQFVQIETDFISGTKELNLETVFRFNETSGQLGGGTLPLLESGRSFLKFKPEIFPTVFGILKDFFREGQQSDLRIVLETGKNSSEPLVFLDNGNRLANAFKQLKEADLITGCDKQELQDFITSNFKFLYRKQVKTFSADYIEKCISRNYYPCKRPLFEVVNGEIRTNR